MNTNPFVGLRPFESDESLLFFGRQEQTMELLQRLHEHHFVAIIGNSGCGKSSLIRGGLIPKLKAGYLVNDSDRWLIAMMKPGQSPLHNLTSVILGLLNKNNDDNSVDAFVEKIREEGADAILNLFYPVWKEQDANLFLLIDQFEELFRFSMDWKEAAKKDDAVDFVNIMLELSRQTHLPIYIVMTMRSDFIGDCAQFFGLPEAMNQSQYLVPRLNRIQLKNAIEGPVRLYGSTLHPTLTSRLLNDADIIKDELPLLQHALMRIWDHKMTIDQYGELTLEDYESIGGIEKALSYHADEALKGMSAEELSLTKQIFQALIVTDEGGRKVRRPVLVSELSSITGKNREQLMAIIDRFSEDKRSFLVISKPAHSKDELIDISHESLIRQWDTLRVWADEEAKSSKIYLQLNESSSLYGQGKKDLLKGREFQIAMQWYEIFKPSSVWAKRYNDGFDESINYLLKSSKEAKSNERKKRNRLTLVFTAIIVSLCAVFLYIKSKTDAQKESAVNLKDAFALNSTANNLELDNPTVAIRLAEAGFEKVRDPSFTETMQKIYSKNAFYKTVAIDSSEVPSLAVSPDGKTFLTGSNLKTAKLWDFKGRILARFRHTDSTVGSAVFSPDGQNVLTGSWDGTAVLWDLKGNRLQEYKADGGKVYAAIFSPDGTKVLTGSWDGAARLYGLNGILIKTFPKHAEHIRCLAFSPDGKKILTGSEDKTARLWDLNGNMLQEFAGHKNSISAIAFSPDGTKIATGSFDETVRLWDVNANVIQELIGHYQYIYSVAFSKDGSRILTSASDNCARLWDLKGNVLQEFKGHTGRVTSACFMQDDTKIITASTDESVKTWFRVNCLFREFRGFKDSVNIAVFSPDGKKVFIGSTDKTRKLFDLSGHLILEFKLTANIIRAAAFSPDGSKLLLASGNQLEFRSLRDQMVTEFIGHTGRITSIAISSDGKKILSGSNDGTAILWNIDGNPLQKINVKEKVIAVSFSNDQGKILTVSDQFDVGTWNFDGSLLKMVKLKEKKIPFDADYSSIAFSPDKNKILVSNRDTTARLWSITGDSLAVFKSNGDVKSVLAVAFSPDGKRVVTGSEDYQVRLWDIDGHFLLAFKGHNECIVGVNFSPDGTKIISASEDMTARLWDNMPLEYFLKNNLVDKLTKEQENRYGIKH